MDAGLFACSASSRPIKPLAGSTARSSVRRARRVGLGRRMTITKHAGVLELVELFGQDCRSSRHPVAGVTGAAEQALVDERGDRVDVGPPEISSTASALQPPVNTARRAKGPALPPSGGS